MTLRLDYSNMMLQPGGIAAELWTESAGAFPAAHSAVTSLCESKEIGFVDLPGDRRLLAQVREFADRARGKFDDVVILGIGGSALGPIALRTYLEGHQ